MSVATGCMSAGSACTASSTFLGSIKSSSPVGPLVIGSRGSLRSSRPIYQYHCGRPSKCGIRRVEDERLALDVLAGKSGMRHF